MKITDLPIELKIRILFFLEEEDIWILKSVCKDIRICINNNIYNNISNDLRKLNKYEKIIYSKDIYELILTNSFNHFINTNIKDLYQILKIFANYNINFLFLGFNHIINLETININIFESIKNITYKIIDELFSDLVDFNGYEYNVDENDIYNLELYSKQLDEIVKDWIIKDTIKDIKYLYL